MGQINFDLISQSTKGHKFIFPVETMCGRPGLQAGRADPLHKPEISWTTCFLRVKIDTIETFPQNLGDAVYPVTASFSSSETR